MAVGRVSPRTDPEKLAGECLGWNPLTERRQRQGLSSRGLRSRQVCMLPLSCNRRLHHCQFTSKFQPDGRDEDNGVGDDTRDDEMMAAAVMVMDFPRHKREVPV